MFILKQNWKLDFIDIGSMNFKLILLVSSNIVGRCLITCITSSGQNVRLIKAFGLANCDLAV